MRGKKFAKSWIITRIMKALVKKISFQVSLPEIKPHMQVDLFEVEELQTHKHMSHDKVFVKCFRGVFSET